MHDWPTPTLVDRTVPKSRLLAHAAATARLKRLLTEQVREIRWHAKLSPETLNLPASPECAEIEVFRIHLKGDPIDPDVLDLVDKAVAQPILFTLQRPGGNIAASAAFKRPSEADSARWVVGERFTTEFGPPPASPPPLPAAVDLGRLYAALLDPLLPLKSRPGEPLVERILRCTDFESVRRQADQLAARVRRERQFNRKVELNRELNTLKRRLESLEEPVIRRQN